VVQQVAVCCGVLFHSTTSARLRRQGFSCRIRVCCSVQCVAACCVIDVLRHASHVQDAACCVIHLLRHTSVLLHRRVTHLCCCIVASHICAVASSTSPDSITAMLQCVAVCCSVLQRVAACCSVLCRRSVRLGGRRHTCVCGMCVCGMCVWHVFMRHVRVACVSGYAASTYAKLQQCVAE